jgi:iron complex outermembrane receptor protein
VVVPLCTPTTPGGSLEIERSDVTGRLGVRYAPDSRSNLYLQYARGSKSGGFGISACGNTFRPEQLDAFELGWKNELLGRTLRVNAAAYYYDYKDLQVEQITGTSLFIQNAPKSRIYGVEVEALWAPDAHWEVSLGASAMRARYVTFSDADPIKPQLGLLDLSGERLNRAPDWTLGLGVQYTLDLPGGAALRPRADLYATGSYALRPYGDPADQQSSYATVSLSLAWLSTDRRWTVRAYGRNITNEAYLQGVVGNPGEGRLGAYAPPRTWGAELSAKF